jgi:Thioester domain
MKIRLFRFTAAVLAVVLLLAAAPRASANTITAQFVGTSGSSSVSYSLNGNAGNAIPGPYYWDSTPPPNGGSNPVATFCVELTQGIPSGAINFNVVSLTDAPTIATGNAAQNQAKADAIMALFGNNYKTAWNTPGTANNDTSYKAFQLALWELTYDGTYDIAHPNTNWFGSGSFQSSDSAAAGAWLMLNDILNNPNGISAGQTNFANNFPGMGISVLTSGGAQDQIILDPPGVVGVPAPPGVLFAGFGLIALVGRGRWVRRTPNPA